MDLRLNKAGIHLLMFPKEIQIRKVYFFKLDFSYFQKACAKICRFRKSTLCDVKKGIVTSPPKLAATLTVWFQEANTERFSRRPQTEG